MKSSLVINPASAADGAALRNLLEVQAQLGCNRLEVLASPPAHQEGGVILNFGLPETLSRDVFNTVLFLHENPYQKRADETVVAWKSRINSIHQVISSARKIVTTSPAAYRALLFRHAQAIYYAPMPDAYSINCLGATIPVSQRRVFVLDKGMALSRFMVAVRHLKSVQVVGVGAQGELAGWEVRKILSAKEIYWLTDHAVRYEGVSFNPASLAMAGYTVNTRDGAPGSGLNGRSASEIRSALISRRSRRTSAGSPYRHDPGYSLAAYFESHGA